jgi:hypothetical protein
MSLSYSFRGKPKIGLQTKLISKNISKNNQRKRARSMAQMGLPLKYEALSSNCKKTN